MKNLFNEWYSDIEHYCADNELDFNKAKSMPKSCGKNELFLQYYNPSEKKLGLLDETPMPVVLIIKQTAAGLVFEQTEYTQKYLA